MTKPVRATPSTAQIVRAIPKGSVQDKNSISFRKQDVWFPLDQELLGHLVQTLASVKETGRYGRQQLRRQKQKTKQGLCLYLNSMYLCGCCTPHQNTRCIQSSTWAYCRWCPSWCQAHSPHCSWRTGPGGCRTTRVFTARFQPHPTVLWGLSINLGKIVF